MNPGCYSQDLVEESTTNAINMMSKSLLQESHLRSISRQEKV